MSLCPWCHRPGATAPVRLFGVRGTRVLHDRCIQMAEELGLPTQRLDAASAPGREVLPPASRPDMGAAPGATFEGPAPAG